MKKTLLIAGLVVSLAAAARADHDSLLPPRAKQLFPHMAAKAPSSDVNLANVGPKGPAAKAPLSRDWAPAARAADEPNLLPRPLYTGKHPVRELRGERTFEVAPLGKGKACEPGCTKACCAKK